MAISLLSRLHLSSQPVDKSSAAPTLASCGNNPERYVKAMEQHFAGDGAKLYAHVAGLKQSDPQSANLRAAFIDGSEALRDFLDIRNPNSIRKKLSFGSSSPRIPDTDAPAGLVMAATHSTQAKRVQRSLARLEEALKTNPLGGQASPKYLHSVGTELGNLMQDLHKLPTEALQQKAVEIIGQHLPQLNFDAREHIQSLAHNALGRQNIGKELKASLQDLIQSKGQATLGTLLKKEESPQPKRTDNRGKAGFASTLKNSTAAPSKSGVTNPASRPYVPIKLKTYLDYAGQNKVQVQCTDYARQAAELLIDKNGELDGTHISLMLDQLKADKTMPAEHRRHLMQTLVKFKQGGELADTINSICEDKPLKGGAADVVRGTLNLTPEHELTQEDARKAVVMSLLGYLRQGNVGSCFATAPAICLLDSSQEVVAKDMKELLEENKLTVQQNGVLTEIPLNQHVYHAHKSKVTVALDGTCSKSKNGLWSKHFKLQDLPGMKAALNALGIPENEWQAAIASALSQMGLVSHYPGMQHEVECKQLIKHLAYQTKGEADPNKRMDAAFRAFNGKQDVGLLQAWEYTLATSFCFTQEGRSLESSPYKIAVMAFYGNGKLPGRPDLQTPAKKNTDFLAQLNSDPRFKQAELKQINNYLFGEIGALVQQRFVQQFDMNIPLSIGSDGVSGYAGCTLYEKIPTDNPFQWKRIDNADVFQEAMARLVQDASEVAQTHIDRMGGDPETGREALHQITDHLVESIRDKTFIEHAVLQMNPDAASEPFGDANQYQKTPWQVPSSGFVDLIAKQYGGGDGIYRNCFLTMSQNGDQNGDKGSSSDATPVVNYFCERLTQMAPELQAKVQESPGGFKVPCAHGSHAFSLMPMEMKEIWSDNPVTPEKWVDDNLKKPADQWLKETRTLPPLSDLLEAVGAEIGVTLLQMQVIHHDLYEKIPKSGPLRFNLKEPSYTLHDVHEKLSEYCRAQKNGDELLAKAENALIGKPPIPAKVIADLNWMSVEGRPLYLGILHNPFTNKMDVKTMYQDATGRTPIIFDWFAENASTYVSSPLATKTKPQENNQ